MNKINEIYTTEYFTGHQFYRATYIKLAQMFYDVLKPKSVLDVGCGTGFMLEYFATIIPSKGIDGSESAKKVSLVSNLIDIHDFRQPLDLRCKWDLVTSIEVAEHIEPEYADNFVDILVRHAERMILMTSAGVGQGGTGHFNCQPKQYWIDKMKERGFLFDSVTTDLIANESKRIVAEEKCPIHYINNNFMLFK